MKKWNELTLLKKGLFILLLFLIIILFIFSYYMINKQKIVDKENRLITYTCKTLAGDIYNVTINSSDNIDINKICKMNNKYNILLINKSIEVLNLSTFNDKIIELSVSKMTIIGR